MGLFSARGRSPSVRICETLNQSKYIEILKLCVLPFKKKYHSRSTDFIYQHGGCGPHRATLVATFLDAEKVDMLSCPFQSPDLNPIENVWGTIKRKLREQHMYPSTADALFQELCSIWNALPDTYFTDLLSSMANRCKAIANDVLFEVRRFYVHYFVCNKEP